MKVCASSGSSNKHLTAPDVRSVLLPEKNKLIAAGARADIAGAGFARSWQRKGGGRRGISIACVNQGQSDGMGFIAL